MNASSLDPVLSFVAETSRVLLPTSEGASEPRMEHSRYLEKRMALEILPHSLGTAYHWATDVFQRMGQLESAVYLEDESADIVTQIMPSEVSTPIHRAVEAYLESARRTQNALQPFLARLCRKQLPASLADIVKGIRSGKSPLPDGVQRTINVYWDRSGWQLKWYRDKSQHYALIPSDIVLWKPRGKPKWAISYLLPDFTLPPSDSISYDTQEQHTQSFVANSFLHLTALVVDCLGAVRALPAFDDPLPGIVLVPKHPSILGDPITGHPQMDAGSLAEWLSQMVAEKGL